MKPFQPKLMGARPRVSQALQQAASTPFVPPAIKMTAPPQNKKRGATKNSASRALQNMTGNF